MKKLILLLALSSSVAFADGILGIFLYVMHDNQSTITPVQIFHQHGFHTKNPQIKNYQNLYGKEIAQVGAAEMSQMAIFHAQETALEEYNVLKKSSDVLGGRRVPIFSLMQEINNRSYVAVAFIDGVVLGSKLKEALVSLIIDGDNALGPRIVSQPIKLKLSKNYLSYEDGLSKTKTAIDQTKDIMQKNLDLVIQRNESLVSLQGKSESLQDSSIKFHDKAKKANSCCR